MCLYLANILISVVLCMVKFVITHLHVSGIGNAQIRSKSEVLSNVRIIGNVL